MFSAQITFRTVPVGMGECLNDLYINLSAPYYFHSTLSLLPAASNLLFFLPSFSLLIRFFGFSSSLLSLYISFNMFSSIIVAAIAIPLALAAPAPRPFPESVLRRQLNDSCSLSTVQQPASKLTPPGDNQLVLIALGQGTQNYTCTGETAVPASIGAVADLFNASCAVSQKTSLGSVAEDANAVGQHFFVDNTTPEFDIIGLGNTQLKKAESDPAPNAAADIPWLKLDATNTNTAVRSIYRLNTKGGLAPATCAGQAAGSVVKVDYEAEYWVYASPDAIAARRLKRDLGLPLN